MISVDLHIFVEKVTEKSKVFTKTFRIKMKEIFLFSNGFKKQNLHSHIYRLKSKIKINQQSETLDRLIKWHIYYVDFGLNIGTEINWIRPAIMFKASKKSYWEDIIVLPITWYTQSKSIDEFDVMISMEQSKWLTKKSLIKTRQIRCVSKKRLWNFIGKITDDDLKDLLQDTLAKMMSFSWYKKLTT